MRLIQITCLVFCALKLSAHDIPLAFFTFDIEETTINLKIQFDAEDLNYAVSAYTSQLINNDNALHTDLISQYINEHLDLKLNGDKVEIHILELVKNDEHYVITIQPTCMDITIKSINMTNSCLIDEIDKHSNIIRLNQRGKKQRGFRLHEDRQSTLIYL